MSTMQPNKHELTVFLINSNNIKFNKNGDSRFHQEAVKIPKPANSSIFQENILLVLINIQLSLTLTQVNKIYISPEGFWIAGVRANSGPRCGVSI